MKINNYLCFLKFWFLIFGFFGAVFATLALLSFGLTILIYQDDSINTLNHFLWHFALWTLFFSTWLLVESIPDWIKKKS